MELILMRHGKAEDLMDRLVDHERELTPEGRKKVRKAARGLTQLISEPTAVHIWSSPLPRARQTADVLAEYFPGAVVRELEAVYSGNLDSVVQAWIQLPEEAVLIVVGHEPYLSIWAEMLSGVSLQFKRAAAAGFILKEPERNEGKLRWFAHGKILARIAGQKMKEQKA